MVISQAVLGAAVPMAALMVATTQAALVRLVVHQEQMVPRAVQAAHQASQVTLDRTVQVVAGVAKVEPTVVMVVLVLVGFKLPIALSQALEAVAVVVVAKLLLVSVAVVVLAAVMAALVVVPLGDYQAQV